jgi:preprotein translocase subunit SecG
MEIAVGIVLIVIAIFLIVAVLFQSSKNARLSGAIAGSAETFFGKAKGKSVDKKLNTLTVIVSIVFAVAVLVVYAIQPGKAKIDYDYDYLESYIDGVVGGSIDISVSEEEEEEEEHDHDHESESDSSADAEK